MSRRAAPKIKPAPVPVGRRCTLTFADGTTREATLSCNFYLPFPGCWGAPEFTDDTGARVDTKAHGGVKTYEKIPNAAELDAERFWNS